MISIVTTAYNNTKYIKEALDSFVESCEGLEYEILVGIDNCNLTLNHLSSIFDTLNDRIKIYYFEIKSGTYIIRNSLAKIAKYDNLIFFDSDDVMRNQTARNALDALTSGYDYYRFGFIPFQGVLKYSKKDNLNTKFSHHFGAFAIKKNLFLSMNGFEPWICAADGEFFWRIQSTNVKIKNSNDVDILYRRHDSNLTSGSQTGMNSPLRKSYHEKKNYKIKNNLNEPLKELTISSCVLLTKQKNKFIIQETVNNNKKVFHDLSIIIPTYNNVKYLDECLNSILISAKDSNCEILVGIDKCKKTLEKIKKQKFDKRISFFYFNKNSGPYVVKNTLAKESKSNYLLFFDSDDIMGENMIAEIQSKMKQTDFIKPMYLDFKDGKKIEYVEKTNKYGEGVFAIKRDLFLNMNGFEPWRCAADSDFMGRLYKNNKKFLFTNQVSFYRRIHPNSLTQNSETCGWSKLRAQYYRISKSKKDFGPLPELVTESFDIVFVEKFLSYDLPKLEIKNDFVPQLMNKIQINPNKQQPTKPKPIEQKTVDYESVNEATKNRGTYVPKKTKPLRENVPNDRNRLQELKKNGQNTQQLEKLFKTKPNRRNGLPNIF